MTCRANGAAVRSWRRVGNNSIRVRLSGGNGAQDLQLVISGHGLNPFTLASDSRAAGTYTYRFPFEDIPEGHYTTLTARWPRSPIVAEANLSLTAPICAGGLSDPRTELVYEYRTVYPNGTPAWRAGCQDFTNVGGSANFSWAEWSGGSDHQAWAVAGAGMFANLESVLTNYGGALRIESAYRCPGRNAAVGGAGNSRHMYGDAVDLTPVSQVWSHAEYLILSLAARRAGATFIEPWGDGPGQTMTHVHADWR